MIARILLSALFLLTANAAPPTPPVFSGSAVSTDLDKRARKAQEKLKSNYREVHTLAERIARSRIGPVIADSQDILKNQAFLREWITQNIEDASHLAIGFEQDDETQTSTFEDSLFIRISRHFEIDPDRHRALVDRLTRAARETRSMIDESLPPSKRNDKPNNRKTAAHAGDALYDRLSSANPTGYSPAVQAFQSAMNLRHVPGAPNLIETGKIDYPTLHYPYFGMRYDIDRLKNKKGPLPPALTEAFARAETALEAFVRATDKAKDSSNIKSELIFELSKKRREVARWIAYTAQLKRITQLQILLGFWDEKMRAQIASAPVSEEERTAYLLHGEGLRKKIHFRIIAGEAAAKLLAPAPKEPALGAWIKAEKEFLRSQRDLKILNAHVRAYREAPARLIKHHKTTSRVRIWVEDGILRFFPNSERAQNILNTRKEYKKAYEMFSRIARSRP